MSDIFDVVETRTITKYRVQIGSRKFCLTPEQFQNLKSAVNSHFSLHYTYNGCGKAGDVTVAPVIKITRMPRAS